MINYGSYNGGASEANRWNKPSRLVFCNPPVASPVHQSSSRISGSSRSAICCATVIFLSSHTSLLVQLRAASDSESYTISPYGTTH